MYSVHVTDVTGAAALGREAVDVHVLARLQPGSPRSRRSPPPARFVYAIDATFRVGSADIVFITLSERRRFPASTETRLLSLLHARAVAQVL